MCRRAIAIVVTLWIYDHVLRRPQLFRLPLWAQMPFVERFSFPVSVFLGRAHLAFAWSDRRALEALDALSAAAPFPLRVSRAFAEPALPSPHGGGTAFDVGRELPPPARARLRRAAVRTGRFYHVGTESLPPDCLHLEALAPRTLRPGDTGADVCRLQALLQHCGLQGVARSGTYCQSTQQAVLHLQRTLSLPPSGAVDVPLLQRLLTLATQTER